MARFASALDPVPRGTEEDDRHPLDRPLSVAATSRQVVDLPLDLIDVAENVRKEVGDLEELAASLKEHGVLQPVKVCRAAGGRWTLLFGQRRVLAARLAGLVTVPAMVEKFTPDAVSLQLEQLVENLQRADMAPLEEAGALRAVLGAWPGMTHDQLAAKLGRSRPWVSNTLRLLEAPEAVRAALTAGEVSATAARAAIGLDDRDAGEWLGRARTGANARDLESVAEYLKSTVGRRAGDRDEQQRQWQQRVERLRTAGATEDSVVVCWDAVGHAALVAAGFAAVRDRPEGAWFLYGRPHDCCDCDAWNVTSYDIHRCCVAAAHEQTRVAAADAARRALNAEWELEGAKRRAAEQEGWNETRVRMASLSAWDLVRLWAMDLGLEGDMDGLREVVGLEEVEDEEDDAFVARLWAALDVRAALQFIARAVSSPPLLRLLGAEQGGADGALITRQDDGADDLDDDGGEE